MINNAITPPNIYAQCRPSARPPRASTANAPMSSYAICSLHSGQTHRSRLSILFSIHACMHSEHVEVSCQQFAVIRRVLKSSIGFEALQSRQVRSSIGVPRRGVDADELANAGWGGVIVVGETKLKRECAVLDTLVGDVRLVAMCEENVLLRWEYRDVGRLPKVSRGEPGLRGE